MARRPFVPVGDPDHRRLVEGPAEEAATVVDDSPYPVVGQVYDFMLPRAAREEARGGV